MAAAQASGLAEKDIRGTKDLSAPGGGANPANFYDGFSCFRVGSRGRSHRGGGCRGGGPCFGAGAPELAENHCLMWGRRRCRTVAG